MVSAMGSQKWLTLSQYGNSNECVDSLQRRGMRVIAADLSSSSKPFQSIDWEEGNVPTAIIMGNELTGISDTVRQAADETFYIPMKGFAESLNLSAATAVLVAMLEAKGVLRADSCAGLDCDARNQILLTWLSRSVPGSLAILRREGLSVGTSLWPKIGYFTTKP